MRTKKIHYVLVFFLEKYCPSCCNCTQRQRIQGKPSSNQKSFDEYSIHCFYVKLRVVKLGTKKQAVFFEIFFLFLLSIFRLLHIIMVTTVYTEKIKEQFFNYQRKKVSLKIIWILPTPIAPPPQNRKRGVDASFSFNFGLCLLMRRLSFTLRKKSFREFSLPF